MEDIVKYTYFRILRDKENPCKLYVGSQVLKRAPYLFNDEYWVEEIQPKYDKKEYYIHLQKFINMRSR